MKLQWTSRKTTVLSKHSSNKLQSLALQSSLRECVRKEIWGESNNRSTIVVNDELVAGFVVQRFTPHEPG